MKIKSFVGQKSRERRLGSRKEIGRGLRRRILWRRIGNKREDWWPEEMILGVDMVVCNESEWTLGKKKLSRCNESMREKSIRIFGKIRNIP